MSRGRLLLPDSGRLPGGLWVHAACRPHVVLANTLAGHLSRLSVRLLPGSRTELVMPFDEHVLVRIQREVGFHPDSDLVVLQPSDPRRSRVLIIVLDRDRRPDAFIKATLDEPNELAMRALAELARAPFLVPRPRTVFRVGDWWVTVEDPLPQVSHRPARLDPTDLHDLVTRFQLVLGSKDGQVLGHGDLGPWNLREFKGHGVGIIDWEYAAWAPRAADELWQFLTMGLATTRHPGERIGARTREWLMITHPLDEIAEAVAYVVQRRSRPEAEEIKDDVSRTPALQEFELRLEHALGAVVA